MSLVYIFLVHVDFILSGLVSGMKNKKERDEKSSTLDMEDVFEYFIRDTFQ